MRLFRPLPALRGETENTDVKKINKQKDARKEENMTTQITPASINRNEALQVCSALKAGCGSNGCGVLNHNEALQVRSALKAGGRDLNHNEVLQVRSTLKAGGRDLNHNEALQVRSRSSLEESKPSDHRAA